MTPHRTCDLFPTPFQHRSLRDLPRRGAVTGSHRTSRLLPCAVLLSTRRRPLLFLLLPEYVRRLRCVATNAADTRAPPACGHFKSTMSFCRLILLVTTRISDRLVCVSTNGADTPRERLRPVAISSPLSGSSRCHRPNK